MDISAIQYFMEIASGQTFWNVSENHNISQSSVSKSISRLEEELGIKLFNRDKRSVYLTPAGEIFINFLRKIEPQFKEALIQMEQYSIRKKIYCGVQSLDFLNLNLRIQNSDFEKLYPDVSLSFLVERDPDLTFLELIQEKIDFLIGHKFYDTLKYCDFIPIYLDVLYAILPKNHPLAIQESVDFMEIFNEHFLIRSPVILKVLKDICSVLDCSVPPNLTVFNVPGSELRRDHIISRVSFGEGITLYFKSDIDIYNLDHVCVLPVTGCPEFPIVISKKKGKKLNHYQKHFQDYICNVIFQNKR